MRRAATLLCALALLVIAGTPALAAPRSAPGVTQGDGRTTVSVTFDGTFKGQDAAAKILADHGLAGTFYVNSGYIGYPAYLSLDQLRGISREHSEIGGASLYGNDLSRQSRARARTEVCNDRTTLTKLGFQVTSFAYPYGTSTPMVKSAAQSCGYNSARDVAGLYQSASDCSNCPVGEPVPPVDFFRIRTSSQGVTLPALKKAVTTAENRGGGWVPLVFTKVCVCPDEGEGAISPTDFEAFVTWLADRPATTRVLTVDQVMGGQLKPAVGTPLTRLVPDPNQPVRTEPLSKVPAWEIAGVGIGQSQILFIGLILTTAIVVTYRFASRKSRYVQPH